MQHSSSSDLFQESSTYEATKARESIANQPDPIDWNSSAAFRDCPYRQLHHQKGLIGTIRVRLLEGSNLKRSYWSALALGPVKHLGLSKAHGEVSSFCSFHLEAKHVNPQPQSTSSLDKKPAAKPNLKHAVSPVVPHNDNPVWDQCQFEFRLLKGMMKDGQRLHLKLRVDEDGTAVENLLPGVPSDDSRLLGSGSLDLTELMLGESAQGAKMPSVKDAWIPISLKDHEPPPSLEIYDPDDPLAPPVKPKGEGQPKLTGTIRILVSYTPHGLEPQPKDVVGLEVFARRSSQHNSLRPVIPPLMPLTVLERRGAYMLLEYTLAGRSEKACVRLHRNAVFVLERQNIVDAATNLALLPADLCMTTPVGRAAADMVGPILHASQQVCMPALLSVKLVWMAFRTTTLASISGVQALGSTLWHEGATALTTNDGHPQHAPHSQSHGGANAATAQYVQL